MLLSFRHLAIAASVIAPLSLLFACGTGRSEVEEDCPAVAPTCSGGCGLPVPPQCVNGAWECQGSGDCPPPDGGPDASCPGDAPPCFACPGEAPVAAQCQNGAWFCVPQSCPIQIGDAGIDACSGNFVYGCPASTCGYFIPVCDQGNWSCDFNGDGCDDAGYDGPIALDAPYDAPIVQDAPYIEPFSCGYIECDPSVSYCQIDTGGTVFDDAGSSFSCQPLPASCDGGSICGCVQAELAPLACDCIQQNDAVIVTCVSP